MLLEGKITKVRFDCNLGKTNDQLSFGNSCFHFNKRELIEMSNV